MLLSGKKQKTVVGFCLTRKNAVESVPLAIFCVYDLEETGGSECGARARTPTKRVCAEQARRLRGPGGRPGAHPRGQRGGSPCRPGEGERGSQRQRGGAGWIEWYFKALFTVSGNIQGLLFL